MIIRGKLGPAAVVAGALGVFATLHAEPASAQLLWDWGGGNTVGGSGREVVRFSPQFGQGQIIVSFGDRRLYYITQPGEAISYPIAVPREQSRWQGVESVTQKRVNPTWTPTPTMIAENPRLPRWVPGGHPMNPLGVRALYLGSSMYRIHGTDAPWTIGSAVSKGCIRLYNQDVLDLYPRVNVGAKVTITYQTFTTTGAVSSRGPVPSKSMASSGPVPSRGMAGPKSNGGTFYLFGDDDAPAVKASRPKPAARSKTKSASANKSTSAVDKSASVVDKSASADNSPPAE